MNETNELLLQVLEMLDTACQANLELLRLYNAGNRNETLELLTDLRAVVQAVSNTELASQLEHSCMEEMLENVEETLNDIEGAIRSGNSERAAMKIEFQLFPFLRQVKEGFYFWGAVYPDKKKMAQYYQEEFAEHIRNYYIQPGQPTSYRLSIVVPAYNHLETTKRCIEQLIKETDFEKLNAELLLIDHGSSDGTLEYFEGLGVGKVIHFKRNARMNMFATMFQISQGEYLAYVSNDILVTRNWAEILLQCFASDPKIIVAVPATPNIANLQMLNPPTDDPDQFVDWANGQNKSDPMRWDDRARVMPPIGIYRTQLVNNIGFADPYFYTMEYWDDDFSLRARRAGYRQVICSDVACYHFGSVTVKEGYIKENTLVQGRTLFFEKNGVDAWGNGFCYDYYIIQIVKQIIADQKNYRVLGLDCGMGDTPLQIKNELRHLRQNCDLYQLTSQQEYLTDLAPHSKQALFVADLAEELASAFETQQFNLAYLGRDIGQYENFSLLLEAVSRKIVSGGWFLFTCDNPFYAPILHSLLQFSLPDDKNRCVFAHPERIKAETEKYFSHVQMIPIKNSVNGLDEFASLHYGKTDRLPQIIERLEISRYYFACRVE